MSRHGSGQSPREQWTRCIATTRNGGVAYRQAHLMDGLAAETAPDDTGDPGLVVPLDHQDVALAAAGLLRLLVETGMVLP